MSHNADKILGSVQRIFDMADQGGFSQKENLARLNLWVTNVMMSGIQGSAAMISGITLKVPQIDIDRVAKFLVEKDPAQLVKLREHPKFDAGVLEQAVLRAFVLDDYLRSMDTFYGNSTNLPPSVIDGMMNRFHEFVVKRAFAPEGSNVALSTGDVSMVQGVFSRRMALVNVEHVLELSTDMRRLFRIANKPERVNPFTREFMSNTVSWAFEQAAKRPDAHQSTFIQHEASLMVLHNFAGDAGMRDKLAKDFPNETVVLRERMMASVDKLNETISEIGMNTNDAPMFMPKKDRKELEASPDF